MFWKTEREALRRRLDDANYAVDNAHRAMQKSQHTIFNQTKALTERKIALDKANSQYIDLCEKHSNLNAENVKLQQALKKSQDEGQKTLKQLGHMTNLKNRMQSERDQYKQRVHAVYDIVTDDIRALVGGEQQ
jgi:chromosome segregation ATPase